MSFNTWMPFYWADYFAHTSHLNAAEHGAYLMLIGHLWTTKKSIPNDDTILARIARCTIQEWQGIRIQIEPMFDLSEKGWNHNRVKNELKRAQNLHEKRVEAGKKRQSKTKDLPAPAEHTTQPGYTQSQPQPQSISYPTDMAGKPPLVNDDLKSRIWGPALNWLAKQSGKPPDRMRAMLGKWCKTHGEGTVLEALTQAAKQSPLAPIPYVEKVLRNAKQSRSTITEQGAAALEALADITGYDGMEGLRAVAEGGDAGPIIDMDGGITPSDTARD